MKIQIIIRERSFREKLSSSCQIRVSLKWLSNILTDNSDVLHARCSRINTNQTEIPLTGEKTGDEKNTRTIFSDSTTRVENSAYLRG